MTVSCRLSRNHILREGLNMKERYEKPEIEIVAFDTKDVIATSFQPIGDGDND